MLSIAAINDEGASERWQPLGPTKEAQESRLMLIYREALDHMREGRPAAAQECFKSILSDPLTRSAQTKKGGALSPMLHLRFLACKNLADLLACAPADLGGAGCTTSAAVEWYLQAVAIDAGDVVTWHHLSRLAMAQGRLGIARRAFEQGLLCSPRHWGCLEKLAEVLAAIGDEAACLQLGKRIVQLAPTYAGSAHMDRNTFSTLVPLTTPGMPGGIERVQDGHADGGNDNSEGEVQRAAQKAVEQAEAKEDGNAKRVVLLVKSYTWASVIQCLLNFWNQTDHHEVELHAMGESCDRVLRMEDAVLPNTEGGCSIMPSLAAALVTLVIAEEAEGGDNGAVSHVKGDSHGEEYHHESLEGPGEAQSEQAESCTGVGKAREGSDELIKAGEGLIGQPSKVDAVLERGVSVETQLLESDSLADGAGEGSSTQDTEAREERRQTRRTRKQEREDEQERQRERERQEQKEKAGEVPGDSHGGASKQHMVQARLEAFLVSGLAEVFADAVGPSQQHGNNARAVHVATNAQQVLIADSQFLNDSIKKLHHQATVLEISMELIESACRDHKQYLGGGGVERLLLELEAKVRAWCSASGWSPSCHLFLAELSLDQMVSAADSNERGTWEEQCRYHLSQSMACATMAASRGPELDVTAAWMEGEAQVATADNRAGGVARPRGRVMDSSFWARYHWACGSLWLLQDSLQSVDRARQHMDCCQYHLGPTAVLQLPNCRALGDISSAHLADKLKEVELDGLLAGDIGRMLQAGNHEGVAATLEPMLFPPGTSGVQYARGSICSGLPTLLSSCQILGGTHLVTALRCLEKILDTQQGDADRQGLQDADIMAQLAACTTALKVYAEGTNEAAAAISVALIASLQQKVLAVLLKLLALEDDALPAGASVLADAALTFCQLQHLHPSATLHEQVRLLSIMHQTLAERGMCCAANGAFLKMAVAHLSKVENTIKLSTASALPATSTAGIKGKGSMPEEGGAVGSIWQGQGLAMGALSVPQDDPGCDVIGLMKKLHRGLDEGFYCLYGLRLTNVEGDMAEHANTSKGDLHTQEQAATIFHHVLPYARTCSVDGLRSYVTPAVEGSMPETREQGQFAEVYENLYCLLWRAEDMSFSKQDPGFAMTQQGEEFVERYVSLLKYDICSNPRRFASWKMLAELYDEVVDLILNDGSKSMAAWEWRQNHQLALRILREAHELLGLVLYDSVQNVYPSFDQRRHQPAHDEAWQKQCKEAFDHIRLAFGNSRKDWKWPLYLGKLSEKLDHPFEESLAYYKEARDLNPLVVEPLYRLHASRLKALNKVNGHKASTLKLVGEHCFQPATVENIEHILGIAGSTVMRKGHEEVLPSEPLHSSFPSEAGVKDVDVHALPSCDANNGSPRPEARADREKQDVGSQSGDADLKTSSSRSEVSEMGSARCNINTHISGLIERAQPEELEKIWAALFQDGAAAMRVCQEGERKHFHKARYALAKAYIGRGLPGDANLAKEELSFCFRTQSSNRFIVNVWEIDEASCKTRHKKVMLGIGLPESSRKFVTCVRKYLLLYLFLCQETNDLSTLEKAAGHLKSNPKFVKCLADIGEVALGYYILVLAQAVTLGAGLATEEGQECFSHEQLLEKLFSLYLEQGAGRAWSEGLQRHLREAGVSDRPEVSEEAIYGHLHGYLDALEAREDLAGLEAANEKLRRRFRRPRLSGHRVVAICHHAWTAWSNVLLAACRRQLALQEATAADTLPSQSSPVAPDSVVAPDSTVVPDTEDEKCLMQASVDAAGNAPPTGPLSAQSQSPVEEGGQTTQQMEEFKVKAMSLMNSAQLLHKTSICWPLPGTPLNSRSTPQTPNLESASYAEGPGSNGAAEPAGCRVQSKSCSPEDVLQLACRVALGPEEGPKAAALSLEEVAKLRKARPLPQGPPAAAVEEELPEEAPREPVVVSKLPNTKATKRKQEALGAGSQVAQPLSQHLNPTQPVGVRAALSPEALEERKRRRRERKELKERREAQESEERAKRQRESGEEPATTSRGEASCGPVAVPEPEKPAKKPLLETSPVAPERGGDSQEAGAGLHRARAVLESVNNLGQPWVLALKASADDSFRDSSEDFLPDSEPHPSLDSSACLLYHPERTSGSMQVLDSPAGKAAQPAAAGGLTSKVKMKARARALQSGPQDSAQVALDQMDASSAVPQHEAAELVLQPDWGLEPC
eukprot:SM000077S21531  [mRNA]  locus=s77:30009:40972:+ [translate_table: standard]